MNTYSRFPKRQHLVRASAALVFCAHGALASQGGDGAQMQAGALLTGGSAGRPSAVGSRPVSSADHYQVMIEDPQGQARRILEGASTFSHIPHPPLSLVSTAPRATSSRGRNGAVHGDAQESAYRLIAGRSA